MIKKIVLSAVLGLALMSPVMADECKIATKEAAQEQLVTEPNLHHRMLSENELKALTDTKGLPPNAEEGSPIEGELVYNDELAGVNIYQNGCFINRLGPATKFGIFQLLGISETSL